MSNKHKEIVSKLYNVLVTKKQVTLIYMVNLISDLFPEYRNLDLNKELSFLFN